ncbi:hypothetical protein Syun_013602 [Stephania yunnanensis]|uniref:CG-1 domain-containing protein n=1 Tax=Stephania yunnanensis TaxID=152371 RepID=A0AAP0P7S0_9MAGN
MLEEDYMHIVLVHYREVKSNKMNFGRARDTEEASSASQMSSPASSNILTNQNHVLSQSTDTMSLSSVQTSEYEDAESADNCQASSRYQSFPELHQPEDRAVASDLDSGIFNAFYSPYVNNQYYPVKQQQVSSGLNFVSLNDKNQAKDNNDSALGLSFGPRKEVGLTSQEETFEHFTLGMPRGPHRLSICSTEPMAMSSAPRAESMEPWQHFADAFGVKDIMGSRLQEKWQVASDSNLSHLSKWQVDQKLHSDLACELSANIEEQKTHRTDLHYISDPSWGHLDLDNGQLVQDDLQIKLSDGGGLHLKSGSEENLGGNVNYSFAEKQTLVDETKAEGLKKLDSFNRWMSRELGEVAESHVLSRSVDYWDAFDGETAVNSSISPQSHLDAYLLSPSLSQEQLFSIIDFSPTWAYMNSETKILITGAFLRSQQDIANCQWSCMFGEVEVPLEVLSDGVLRCHAPKHAAGRVPFYITCSNRLACSEVREFEFRVGHVEDLDMTDLSSDDANDMLLHIRLGKLLSLGPVNQPIASTEIKKPDVCSKISSLLKENDDDWSQMMKLSSEKELSPSKLKEQLLQKILKDKLHTWLLHKVNEDGKGPNVWDEEGQGVIHLAAALGYDWAIAPTVAAGVSINFRDVNGWTALHWAAFCGRERPVGALISLGAAPGLVTDPSPQFPAGRTPAELASSSGHKGIAGYLAEISLVTHLDTLTLKDANSNDAPETSMVNTVRTVSERIGTQTDNSGSPDLSLKDSLTAVSNASLAAARIHQVFRVQSFQKKQLVEYGDEKFGMSDERALSLISIKSQRPGQHDEPVAAAIRIQNKFRGWKGRKEFMILRQRVVKIQALVRGHQVRKHYRKIIWSVGIVEKAILRWRRKGCGLRGFRPDALIEGTSRQSGPSNDDDYDFLKEGRKQTEERFQKALARVKSMVQYPEARDQYRRIINVVTEFQETQVIRDRALDSEQQTGDVDDLIDFDALLGDDTFMSTAG